MIAKLFAKKKAGQQAPATQDPSLGTPAYYEVWGSLESANRALWAGLWLASTVALLALLVVRILLSRPPIVIRVDGAGRAETLADAGRSSAVSEPEVKNFLSLFERFFTEL